MVTKETPETFYIGNKFDILMCLSCDSNVRLKWLIYFVLKVDFYLFQGS